MHDIATIFLQQHNSGTLISPSLCVGGGYSIVIILSVLLL